MIAASSMPRCRTVIDDLFLDAPNVKRYETSFVFGPIKRGLNIPIQDRDQITRRRTASLGSRR
jgi:hypothetical protein